jgi:type I restriction enzyme S subunit
MKNRLPQKNIPVGWQELKIRDIADPVSSLNAGNKPYEVLSCTKHDGLVPSLQYFGRKVYGNDLSKYKVVPYGYFAYATNHIEEGSIGYQNLIDFGLVSPMYTVFKLKENLTNVDPIFLYRLLKSPLMVNKYRSIISASVARRGGLRWNSFSNLKIILPPLKEQRKIVAIESTWEVSVEKISRKIEIQENVKQSLIENLLTGKMRFPGSKHSWTLVKLKDVLTEHRETSTGAEEVHSVSVNKGVVNQIEHLGRSFAAKDISNYKLVKPGDLIYTKSPTGGFPYGIIKQSRINYQAIVSPLYGVFTPKTFSLGSIIDSYFESQKNTARYLKPLIHKGAKNTMNITNTTFLSSGLYLPTDEKEQEEIAKLFATLSKNINTLNKKLSLLREQRKFLLFNLLTGTIRTPEKLSTHN